MDGEYPVMSETKKQQRGRSQAADDLKVAIGSGAGEAIPIPMPPKEIRATSTNTTDATPTSKDGQSALWELLSHALDKWTTLGHWIETSTEAQVAMMSVVYIDLVLSCLLVAVTSAESSGEGGVGASAWLGVLGSSFIVIRGLHALLSLTLTIALLELVALASTFGLTPFLSHAGYTIDSVVVSVSVWHEIFALRDGYDEVVYGNNSNTYRLLGVLKLWRVARLTIALVRVATLEQTQRIQELEMQQDDAETLKSTLTRLIEHSNQERDAKQELEQTLEHYKDEVETLTEALRIAAYDVVAGAAADDIDVDDMAQQQQDDNHKGTLKGDTDAVPSVL
jgi:hypothetical protein